MDCSQIRARVLGGEAPDGPELEAHLAECPPCAELLQNDAALGRRLPVRISDVGEPRIEAMLGELHALMAAKRGLAARLRDFSTPRRLGFALAAVMAVALAQLAFNPRPDLGVYPLAALGIRVLSSSILLVAALAIGLRPLQRALPPRWQRYGLLAAGLALPVILAARPPAHPQHAASLSGVGGDFLQRAVACFGYGMLFAVPLLVLCWALDRGEHRSLPSALLAAAAAGISANLALELHCSIAYPAHLLLGHASVGLVLVLGYAFFRLMQKNALLGGKPEA